MTLICCLAFAWLLASVVAAGVALSAVDRASRRNAEDQAFRALDRAVADAERRRAL